MILLAFPFFNHFLTQFWAWMQERWAPGHVSAISYICLHKGLWVLFCGLLRSLSQSFEVRSQIAWPCPPVRKIVRLVVPGGLEAARKIQTEIRSQICHGESPGSRPGLPGSPGSWVDPPGRPGLAGSLHRPVFWQTRTGPATGSTGSRVDPPGRSGFNNYAQDIIYIILYHSLLM
jgi:hypothetical protein